MSCLYFLKGKYKSQIARSAPELQKQSAPELQKQSASAPDGLHGKKRASKSSNSFPSPRRSITELYKEKEHTDRVFSLSELRAATKDFNRLLKIGEGGFGSVYKGTIVPVNAQGEPLVVAIKKLNRNSLQGHKEWLAEVQFLGVVNHPNLVKLLGYCSADGERGIQRLLVYEFMPNMSLEHHLFSKGLPPLPWKTRLQIILGAAEGLCYLHEELETRVIYRDFKSSNVLLDEEFRPKLSDFGLAREGPTDDRSHVSTAVVGTHGYAAPEYIETGHLTVKSDLWSFGVVLYELITGRRCLERSLPVNEQKLLDWVRRFPADAKRFTTIVDPRLRDHYSVSAARKTAKLAERCLSKKPKDRPKMSEVVEFLKEAIQDSENVYGGHASSTRRDQGVPGFVKGKSVYSSPRN